MPRTKGLSKSRGAPKGVTKPTSQSKSVTICKVSGCGYESRNDKVKAHQRTSVLWTENGLPASDAHPEYANLSEEKKNHTDWFRHNNFSSTHYPVNKRKFPTEGPMEKFVKRTVAKTDVNENNLEDSHDSSDPDNPPKHTANNSSEVDIDQEGSSAAEEDSIEVNFVDSIVTEDRGGRGSRAGVNSAPNPPSPLRLDAGEGPVIDTENSTSLGEGLMIESGSVHDTPYCGDFSSKSPSPAYVSDGEGWGSEAGANYAPNPSSPLTHDENVGHPGPPMGTHSLDQATIEAIANEVQRRFAQTAEVAVHGDLARVIASRVWVENEKNKKREEAVAISKSAWVEDKENGFLICVACLNM